MIIDKIENANLYQHLHPRFAKAFEYLQNTDFTNLADGKYQIDEDNLFAIIQQYSTKEAKDAKLETHFKYIDIQYLISGIEQIGFAFLDDQRPVIKNNKNDIAFYEGEASFIKLEKRMFAVFFPHDMHMPGLINKKSSLVKKIVIKVKR